MTKSTVPQLQFQCCFCSREVRADEIGSLEIAVRLLEKADGEPGVQGLYCHHRCLRDRLAPEVPLITDDL
jgi:hypothetical protein